MPLPSSSLSGAQAEQVACDYLQKQGLTLLKRNYRCRRGEIDLIMQEGETLVFVEVRYRRSSRFGSPSESVTPIKQGRIVTTAQHYLSRLSRTPRCRFDVVTLAPSAGGRPEWIRNAFGAD